jgi:cytochrome b involved in lipid metabolism
LVLFNSGGEEVMLDVGGQDATEAFEDVGHSDEARETLDQLLVGSLKRQVRNCWLAIKLPPSAMT